MNTIILFIRKNTSNAFYKLWTIKESYIKQSGEGLRTPLNSFEININKDTITVSENNTKKKIAISPTFEFKKIIHLPYAVWKNLRLKLNLITYKVVLFKMCYNHLSKSLY